MAHIVEQPNSSATEDELFQLVLTVVRGFVQENRPGSEIAIGKRTRLSDDIGLDSLSRMELLRRIEERLGRSLSERAVLEARDLAALVEVIQDEGHHEGSWNTRATVSSPAKKQNPSLQGERSRIVCVPPEVQTLPEALRFHVEAQPDSVHVQLPFEEGAPQLSYGEFLSAAESAANFLASIGVTPGDRFGLMLPTGLDLLTLYFGGLLLRAVPVPMYPPASIDRLEEHLHRQMLILKNAGVVALILPPEGRFFAPLLQSSVPSLKSVVSPPRGGTPGSSSVSFDASSQELALLQYTSGSTGQPKGVMLTHANLMSNIRAMAEVLTLTSEDVCVSWLPLYHDMGLIGAWLGSLVTGVPLILMSPLTFIAHPGRWLEAITQYRGTVSAGPNFAYQLCADRIHEEQLPGLDLSSWRIAFNGAEPVSARTLEHFATRFGPRGFRASAMRPVYGLAESSLGVLFPRNDRAPRVLSIDRDAFQERRIVVQVPRTESSMLLVGCGEALPGHEVRIIDDRSREVAEGEVGLLQFSGPSSTAGYFENDVASRTLVDGRWRNSGDYAVRCGEDIFIVGRQKDLIIRAGKNIAPQDVEEEVGKMPGVRRGCVVAFGSSDGDGAEAFVIVAETRIQGAKERADLEHAIVAVVSKLFDVSPDSVLLVPPRTIPKTSSGKLRRGDCKQRYLNGTLESTRSGRMQVLVLTARAFLTSCLSSVRRFPRRVVRGVYGAWCWVWFLTLALVALPLVTLCPSASLNRRILKVLAQILLRVCMVRVDVRGLGNLPEETSIVMSNHQSYADTILLTAVLPARFAYVAKRDFLNAAVFQFLFPRIGVLWLDRENVVQSVEDISEIVRTLTTGQSLVFFPEGGFWRDRDMLPFKMGGFLAAARAQVPIVPMGIAGLRDLLPEGSWIPNHATISVRIGAALRPVGEEWSDGVKLRNETEAQVKSLLESAGTRRLQ